MAIAASNPMLLLLVFQSKFYRMLGESGVAPATLDLIFVLNGVIKVIPYAVIVKHTSAAFGHDSDGFSGISTR